MNNNDHDKNINKKNNIQFLCKKLANVKIIRKIFNENLIGLQNKYIFIRFKKLIKSKNKL